MSSVRLVAAVGKLQQDAAGSPEAVYGFSVSTDSRGLASPTPIKDVGVDHGGAHVGVAEQFLHGANIVVALQQMRRERMAQRVRGGRFGDAPSYLLAMTFADNR